MSRSKTGIPYSVESSGFIFLFEGVSMFVNFVCLHGIVLGNNWMWSIKQRIMIFCVQLLLIFLLFKSAAAVMFRNYCFELAELHDIDRYRIERRYPVDLLSTATYFN